jgi:uracil-DNA glycosylase
MKEHRFALLKRGIMCFYSHCRECDERNKEFSPIESYHKDGKVKIMLIGQDPTIRKNQSRVIHKKALMLDSSESQIQKWIIDIFGQKQFDSLEVLATNLIKCVLNIVPSNYNLGSLNYIKPLFRNCKKHLIKEFINYKPEYVFTLGEPCHQLFYSMVKNISITKKLKLDSIFGHDFEKLTFEKHSFIYSPMLHIQTYRVAKKYGGKIEYFENLVKKIGK